MKQFYLKAYNAQTGDLIFSSTSDSAKSLLKRYTKAACFSDGNISSEFYGAKIDTNITPEIEHRIENGENI